MKKTILNLGKALDKKQLKEIKGGNFFHRRTPNSNIWCKYSCTGGGSNARLDGGQAIACSLELPYLVSNHFICGGNDDGGIDGPFA